MCDDGSAAWPVSVKAVVQRVVCNAPRPAHWGDKGIPQPVAVACSVCLLELVCLSPSVCSNDASLGAQSVVGDGARGRCGRHVSKSGSTFSPVSFVEDGAALSVKASGERGHSSQETGRRAPSLASSISSHCELRNCLERLEHVARRRRRAASGAGGAGRRRRTRKRLVVAAQPLLLLAGRN